MKPKTKKRIIIVSVILTVIVALVLVGQYWIRPMVVDYAFDKVVKGALDGMGEAETEKTPDTAHNAEETPDETAAENDETVDGMTQREKEVANMSVSEVASVISSSPTLTSKLESIVSSADKERVLAMLMSNFTSEEISMYAKEVAGGITPARRSELASIARGRMTSAQWSECLGLLAKYVDQLRPIIAEYTN